MFYLQMVVVVPVVGILSILSLSPSLSNDWIFNASLSQVLIFERLEQIIQMGDISIFKKEKNFLQIKLYKIDFWRDTNVMFMKFFSPGGKRKIVCLN